MQQRFSFFRFVALLTAFTGLLALRLVVAPNGHDGMLAFFGCVGLLAASFLVYYAASAGQIRNLLGGALVYAALAAVVAACPLLGLLLLCWSLSSLVRQRRALLMHALASIALFVLIFPMPFAAFVGVPQLAGAPAGIAYAAFAIVWSARESRVPLRTGIFKFATMLLSVPLIASFIALVGGGMLERPERRVRNSLARAHEAANLAANFAANLAATRAAARDVPSVSTSDTTPMPTRSARTVAIAVE